MGERGRYQTRQRELVASCLSRWRDRYLTVDEVCDLVAEEGGLGRTTAYRALESMVADGVAMKAVAPAGATRYRLAPDKVTGQLLCLACGRAYPLECSMAGEFAAHVLSDHGFRIDPARTVLYGLCRQCKEASS